MAGYLMGIEVRRHWRSVLLLALLVALVVGTVLASIAGGRRSNSSFDRYLAQLNSPEIMATALPEDADALDELARLPMVAAAPALDIPAAFPEMYLPLAASTDGTVPGTYLRPPLVEGRRANPREPLEVVVSERTAELLEVQVGDTIPMSSFGPEAAAAFNRDDEQEPAPDGPSFELTVVGIVRDPGDITSRETDLSLTFLTPAFRERFPTSTIGSLALARFIVLEDGADLTTLSAAASGLAIELDMTFSPEGAASQADPTMSAIATALYVFAGVAAAAGLATIGHAVGRMQSTATADNSTLAAMGVDRPGRWARVVAPGWAAVGVGTPLGVGLAVAASPLFPIGLARRAETDLGVDVDLLVLGLGGLASLLAGVGLVALLGRTSARAAAGSGQAGRPSRILEAVTTAGAPPSLVTGIAMSVGSSRRDRSTARAAVAGSAMGVLGVSAAIVFAASVDRLISTPSLYGWGWDANIAGADLSDLGPDASPDAVLEDPDVRAAAEISMQVHATIDGHPVFLTSAIDVKGRLEPVVVRGEEPRAADELALAQDTMHAVGASVGDRVALDLGDGPRPMRVTGIVALPVSSDGGSSTVGAYLPTAAARAAQVERWCEERSSCYRNIAIDIADDSRIADVAARYEDPERNVAVDLPAPPGEVERLTAVRQLPWFLAGLLGVLAAATVTYSAAVAIRRRTRELAVLRVVGMSSAQLRGVVAVQVLVHAATGGLLGAVLGILAGRQVWRWVTTSLAMPFSPAVPVVSTLLVPCAAVAISQLAATFSRRAAGRIQPAIALRTE